MNIIAKSIPHNEHRYETVGDYYIDGDKLVFEISEMKPSIYERLVLIHELIEQSLLEFRGIDIDTIDEFDKAYEAKRQEGDTSEPGFDNSAPYLKEHTFATSVEMAMCALMGISWTDYDNYVMNL